MDTYQWKTPGEVLDFCEEQGVTLDQYYGRQGIYQIMDMIDYAEIPEGFRPSYISSLQLDKVREIPQDFCPPLSNLYIRGGTCLSLGGIREVTNFLSVVGCTALRSLGNLEKAKNLYIVGTPIYTLPPDLEVDNVFWHHPTHKTNGVIMSYGEAQSILKDFKDSIKSNEDAALILLDREGIPLWQIAYVTDYLRGDVLA